MQDYVYYHYFILIFFIIFIIISNYMKLESGMFLADGFTQLT